MVRYEEMAQESDVTLRTPRNKFSVYPEYWKKETGKLAKKVF